MKTNIALLCMTKDGQGRIPRLLDSVKGFVNLAFFYDTSEGGVTADWLEKTALTPYPLHVRRGPFIDFSTTRNQLQRWAHAEALRYADQTWFLLLDDDMALKQDTPDGFAKFKEGLGKSKLVDGYHLLHDEPMAYWVPRLVRGDIEWHYKGVTHEYLWPVRFLAKAEGFSVLHFHEFTPAKFDRDIKLLSADIARDPNDARTIFYLANSLRDKGETKAAIRFFVMRAQMGGWPEEQYVAMYEAARLSEDPKLMEKAYTFRPTRAEPAYWLRNYYQKQDQKELVDLWEKRRASIATPNDFLFVHLGAYDLKPTFTGPTK